MTIDEMRNIDVRTVRADQLTDRRDIVNDQKLPQRERQKAVVQIKEERQLTVENGGRHSEWIDLFRQYENITELQRAVVVNLIERIVIYDSKHIEVVFRYQDQLNEAVQYIDRYKEILPAKEA